MPTNATRDKKSSWVYRNSVETKTAPYSGTITMYKVRMIAHTGTVAAGGVLCIQSWRYEISYVLS